MRNKHLCVLQSAEYWDRTGGADGFDQVLLVAVSLAFQVWGVATPAKDGLERCPIQEKPSLDMRVRDCSNNLDKGFRASEFLGTLRVASAVGIRGDNHKARPRRPLLVQVAQVLAESLHDSPVATAGIAPRHLDIDAEVVGNSPNQSTDHILMG